MSVEPRGAAGVELKPCVSNIKSEVNISVSKLETRMEALIGQKPIACPYCPLRFLLFETKEKHVATVHPEMFPPVDPRLEESVMETDRDDVNTLTAHATGIVDNAVPIVLDPNEQVGPTCRDIGVNTEERIHTEGPEKIHSLECFVCPLNLKDFESLKRHLNEEHEISNEVSSALVSSFYKPVRNQNNKVIMKIEPDDDVIFIGEVPNCQEAVRTEPNHVNECRQEMGLISASDEAIVNQQLQPMDVV